MIFTYIFSVFKNYQVYRNSKGYYFTDTFGRGYNILKSQMRTLKKYDTIALQSTSLFLN